MKEFWFRVIYAIVWPFFTLVHPRKVVGLENIPQGGCLLCGNHTRYSDPLFIVFSMGRKRHPYIMGKAELFRNPVLGWIMTQCGVIPVERGKSDVKAIKECMRILKDGGSLLMFPEGTRVKGDADHEAKTGAAMLALRTSVPIVPVYVPPRLGWFRRTTITFGAAYTPQVNHEGKPTAEDYQPIADDLLERIQTLSETT